MKKIGEEIEDKIIDLYINQKMSTTKVAEEIGISSTGVSKILKRRGCSTRVISDAKKGVKIGTKLPVNKIIDLYINENKSSHEIADIIGFTKTSVLKILRENNIKLRKSGYREDYKNEKTNEIKTLYLSGKSINEVCSIVDMSYGGVNKILNNLSIIRSEDKGKSMLGKKMSKECIDKIRKAKLKNKESGHYDHIYIKKQAILTMNIKKNYQKSENTIKKLGQ